MRYLLDTNAVSDIVKRLPDVYARFAGFPPRELGLSTVTLKEIEYGLKLNPERALRIRSQLTAALSSIRIIPFEAEDAKVTGHLRAQLRRNGTPIGPYDLMLAGTALARDLILVTANTREFSLVPHLRLENWRVPHNEVREPSVEYRAIASAPIGTSIGRRQGGAFWSGTQ